MDKQTPEELDAALQATIAKAEAEKAAEDKENKEKAAEIVKKAEDEPKDDEEVKEEAKDDQKEEDEGIETKEVDYKKKFTESSREAQILHSRQKQFNDAIEKASTLPEPTDAELQKDYPEWETMTETEKRLAIKSFKSERTMALLGEVTKASKDIEAWNTKVDEYIDDPKTLIAKPKLEGKTEEFKEFASKQTRRGLDFDTLVSAFLYEYKETRPSNKGKKQMESGSSGPNEGKQIGKKISPEESALLMKTDYKKWKKLLMEGKIADI